MLATISRSAPALSAGQRHAWIGRAIVRQPKVFMFAEPLSNLDASFAPDAVRIRRASPQLGTTRVYVTHYPIEASPADRSRHARGAVGKSGPRTLSDPANRFVAGFIGSRDEFLDAWWSTRYLGPALDCQRDDRLPADVTNRIGSPLRWNPARACAPRAMIAAYAAAEFTRRLAAS